MGVIVELSKFTEDWCNQTIKVTADLFILLPKI